MAHRAQAVALTMSDGSLTVMQWLLDPVLWIDGALTPVEREVDLDAIQRDIDKTLWTDDEGNKIACDTWRLVDQSALPTDRYFRGAWRNSGRKVTVDMPTAREIHRTKLRRMRAPLLAELDTEYMRADEAGDNAEKKRIATRKQALRDVTADPAIEKAKTPDALKAVLPPALTA